jgi:hypothetical protein
VTFTAPSTAAHATIDVTFGFTRANVGPLAVGYFIMKNGIPPTADRRYRGVEVTGKHFPVTYVLHDGPLTPNANVTYQLAASKLSASAEEASAWGCEMTVTLN